MSYLKAIGLGVVAGMRSMTPPALVAHELRRTGSRKLDGTPLQFLAAPRAAEVTQVLAASEIVADKTPWIPDRISPPGLIGRGVSGALVGAALCSGDGEEPLAGALLGTASALAAAFAAYHLRKRLGEERIPDPVLAVLEDALAVGGGLLILRAKDAEGASRPARDETIQRNPAPSPPQERAVAVATSA